MGSSQQPKHCVQTVSPFPETPGSSKQPKPRLSCEQYSYSTISFFAIYAYARRQFERVQLVEYTQSIAMVLLYMNCVRKHLKAGRRQVFTKRVYLKMATNGQSCGHSSMVISIPMQRASPTCNKKYSSVGALRDN